MDVKVRDFTEWQIDRIRLALNKYRISAARDGYLPSWATVRDSIIYAEPNIARYKRDPENSFHPERLRRFAGGKQRLDVGKLAEIMRFLLVAGALKPDDLDESKSSIGQFLALKDFLGSTSEAAKGSVAALEREYSAERKDSNGISVSFALIVTPDPSKTFVRVEETTQITENDAGSARNDLRLNTKRVGYGLPVSSQNLLHLFLIGYTPDMHLTYVQVRERAQADSAGLLLMRNGAVLPSIDNPWAETFSNVYRFKQGAHIRTASPRRQKPEESKRDIDMRKISRDMMGSSDDDYLIDAIPTVPGAVRAGSFGALHGAFIMGGKISDRDENGMTALHHAAGMGARGFVRHLVKSYKCDFLARDAFGRTPADVAFEWSADPALAEFLARKQARQAGGRNSA